MIEKFKDTVLWTYFITELNSEDIAQTFYKKQLHMTNQTEFRIAEVIKTKGDKGHMSNGKVLVISWSDRKNIVI